MKNMVKRMGKVDSIHLLVIPEPWYEYIKTNGGAGKIPNSIEECKKFVAEYQGKKFLQIYIIINNNYNL